MADSREVVVTVRLEAEDENDVSSKVDTEQVVNDGSKKTKAVFKAMAIQAATVAVNEVSAWAEYYCNKELTLEDDYIGQRNKTVAMTQINRAVGALSTIATMTSLGASAGPWGAAAGALLGAAMATSSIVRSNEQGREQQGIQIRQMNAQLNFTRARAGFSLKAASIGEDL